MKKYLTFEFAGEFERCYAALSVHFICAVIVTDSFLKKDFNLYLIITIRNVV